MTQETLEQHARRQARRIMKILTDAVGREVAANILIQDAMTVLTYADA